MDNLTPIEEMENGTQEVPAEEASEVVEEASYTLPDDETVPEKFRGKSPEDVVKSYVELEKMISRKAEDMAKEMLNRRDGGVTTEQKKDVKEVADEIDFTKMDFTKMSPTDFAKWIIGEVDKRSEAKARHIVAQTSNTQETVRTEIAAAQEKHPHLKDNSEYREAVLSFIENASARGDTLSLEDACQKVDKLMGVTALKPATPAAPVVKKRTGVETAGTTASGDNRSEDDKIKDGIMKAGQKFDSPLGGLGI